MLKLNIFKNSKPVIAIDGTAGSGKGTLANNLSKKLNLEFPLISDPQTQLIQGLNAWKEKSMYGKKYICVDRSTFLINSKGLVVKEWRSVKVKGHVLEVLEALKEI